MKYIVNSGNNPKYNFALEEFCFKNLPKDDIYLIIFINKPTIVLGRDGNLEGLNMDYIGEEKIELVRRITQGPNIYQDYGSLNYSLIFENTQLNFERASSLMLEALKSFQIEASLDEDNIIRVAGRDISYISETVWKDRILNHGSLLYDLDFTRVKEALGEDVSQLDNISNYLDEDMDIFTFSDSLLDTIRELVGEEMEEYKLDSDELDTINDLLDERYSKNSWNYENK